MSAKRPLSVVLPCRNPGPQLHRALATVWAQRSASVEVIVVDGASTDGTGEWLARNAGRIDRLISEPDAGIYAAMNKGVAAATGEWMLFLGADDQLATNTAVADALAHQNATAGVLAGTATYGDGRIYAFDPGFNPCARNFLHHQAALYRRRLFTEHGGFDASLRIAADYEFNLRLWRAGVSLAPVPVRLTTCGIGGASDGGAWAVYREEMQVRHRYFAGVRCWMWDIGSLARYARKRLVRARRAA